MFDLALKNDSRNAFGHEPLANLQMFGPAEQQRPEAGLHAAISAAVLTAAFNEIDYGMILLGDGARVLSSNNAARIELDPEHPLQLRNGVLRTRRDADAAAFQAAVVAAQSRSLRKLLSLRLANSATTVSVSIIPLGGLCANSAQLAASPGNRCGVLVILGKRLIGGELAIEAFARSQGLSAGETRVLRALIAGVEPAAHAAQHGVAISTVRTQIGSIRAKTGAASIRDLLRQVAALPPLLGVLHRERQDASMGLTVASYGQAA